MLDGVAKSSKVVFSFSAKAVLEARVGQLNLSALDFFEKK
jgi:hypothetical protein